MKKIVMTLRKQRWSSEQIIELPNGHHAIWIESGKIETAGVLYEQQSGLYAAGGKLSLSVPGKATDVLIFSVNDRQGNAATYSAKQANSSNDGVFQHQDVLLEESFLACGGEHLLRLDSVSFSAGVKAYRHVHAGPGIRYLTQGSLTLQSDTHKKTMQVGDAWFEDTCTPVQATGSSDETSAFVRALFLPADYLGKPTIRLLNSEDESKPKLQTNTRYLDQFISL